MCWCNVPNEENEWTKPDAYIATKLSGGTGRAPGAPGTGNGKGDQEQPRPVTVLYKGLPSTSWGAARGSDGDGPRTDLCWNRTRRNQPNRECYQVWVVGPQRARSQRL
ncbi:unnamed protein product [Pleuronectes platessa]|uniref:Uncharacterized protein n=1 Tax=Pleuronectes platessa TaxID=8262 RepID=A0A9N7V2C1_PLEPL|nr:unnamed protein product [Pleuronectes platessa]